MAPGIDVVLDAPILGDQGRVQMIGRALRREAGGAVMRTEMIAAMRAVVQPAAEQAKANIRSAPSPLSHTGVDLRSAIAARVGTQVRLAGRMAGVSVRVRKTPGTRGFATAPMRFNRAKFRHPLWGRDAPWVDQVGKPDWFDGPIRARRPEMLAAVRAVIAQMAERIGVGI